MKRIQFTLFFVGIASIVFAQQSSEEIIRVGTSSVTTPEFEYIYKKNNSKNPELYTEKNLKEYLDLFVNFKLKVTEAENLKLDTAKSFIKELNGYKKQLAKPYLTDKSFVEKQSREAYERMKEEVSASHILIKVNEDAEPSDTLKAFQKITEIRNRIVKGEDFGKVSEELSEDPSAKMKQSPIGYQGNLGYFTAFNMVYEFENAAFTHKVGEVSKPFRTKFGYHILKVNDRRASKGEVKVAHIMINAADGMMPEDSIAAYNRIQEIYKKAVGGEDWVSLCKENSEHYPTKNNGGELRPFTLGGQLGAPAFETAAFALKNKGDISTPVKTSFGWHVIKLLDHIYLDTYDNLKADITNKVSKDSRSQLNQKELIKKLKVDNKFVHSKKHAKNLQTALSKSDSSILKAQWKYVDVDVDADLSKPLFTINAKVYTMRDFFEYAKQNQSPKVHISPKHALQLIYNKYVDHALIEYEEVNLENKFVDYKMLVKEYRDGIMLFQLMDEKVWSKAIKDSVGLSNYFKTNTGKYVWETRARMTILDIADKSTHDAVSKDLLKKTSIDQLLNTYNKANETKIKHEDSFFSKNDKEYFSKIDWKVGSYSIEHNGRYYIITITEILDNTNKTLDEAKGLVIADYQNFLEKEWLKTLREKYPVMINDAQVSKLVKK